MDNRAYYTRMKAWSLALMRKAKHAAPQHTYTPTLGRTEKGGSLESVCLQPSCGVSRKHCLKGRRERYSKTPILPPLVFIDTHIYVYITELYHPHKHIPLHEKTHALSIILISIIDKIFLLGKTEGTHVELQGSAKLIKFIAPSPCLFGLHGLR